MFMFAKNTCYISPFLMMNIIKKKKKTLFFTVLTSCSCKRKSWSKNMCIYFKWLKVRKRQSGSTRSNVTSWHLKYVNCVPRYIPYICFSRSISCLGLCVCVNLLELLMQTFFIFFLFNAILCSSCVFCERKHDRHRALRPPLNEAVSVRAPVRWSMSQVYQIYVSLCRIPLSYVR